MGSWTPLISFALAVSGCVTEQAVDLYVRGDGSGSGATVTVMVTTGACPDIREALASDLTASTIYSETAEVGATLRPVGVLEDRPYAFTAIFRDSSCLPTQHGCIEKNPLEAPPVVVDTARVDDAVRAGASCSSGSSCRAGRCEPVTPPSPCSSDGVACMGEDGISGMCCDGTCVLESPAGCSTVTCGDTSSDAANCGECGHACPADLTCVSSLCRVDPPPTSITLSFDVSGDGLSTALAAFVWYLPSGPTTDGGIVAVGPTRPLDLATGDGTVEVALPDISEVPLEAWTDAGGAEGSVTFAHIVISVDADGDRVLNLDEVDPRSIRDAPSVYGLVADHVVVASVADVARGGLLELSFPEGIGRGVGLYRGASVDVLEFVPASDARVVVTTCISPGASEQLACIDALRGPLSR